MKIVLDARFFGTETGIGRYVKEIIEHLERVDLQNDYIIFLRKENWKLYEPKNSRFTKKLINISWYSLSEQLFLGMAVDKERADLCHFPHFNAPFFCATPYIVTIHDLILKQFKTGKASRFGALYFYIKYFFYELLLSRVINKAKKIITPTFAVRNDLIKCFNINPDKARVIYEGLNVLKDGYTYENFLSRLGIGKTYILYVGNCYPHKNLKHLLEAFFLVKRKLPELQLVLSGKRDFFSCRLEEEIKKKWTPYKKKYPEDIIFTGYIDDARLAFLYKKAKALVAPALIEGFGLPPLEAIFQGTIPAVSRIPVFLEVLADAAFYFNPKDIEDMARVLEEAISDNDKRQKVLAGGYKRLMLYDWSKSARETLDVYESVLKK